MEVVNSMIKLMAESTKVEDMKNKLEHIKDFIYHADRLVAVTEGGNKKNIKHLIKAVFVMEDMIDEYTIIEEQEPLHLPGCADIHCEIVDYIKSIFLRHRIRFMYMDLNSRFNEITKEDGRQIQPTLEQDPLSGENRKANLQREYMNKAFVVVGFDAQIDKLIGWLVKGSEELTAISVVGMAGTGKTTLAKAIFQHKRIIDLFDCCVWITVSSSSTVEELLRDMLHMFYKQSGDSPPQGIFAMDRVSLIDEVSNYLRQKRYVVFFDDLWDKVFWHDIGLALIENRKGSRIFITTTSMNVALSSKKFYPLIEVHEMEHLTPESSSKLFTMMAFQSDYKGNYHKDLEDITSEIVSKCKGLPLALLTIAGSLSGKTKTEWKRFSQNLSSELEKNPDLHGVTDIFSLSYDDLPSHLKVCLLYFAIYPEDYEVKSKRLIRQWIAEGFVREESGKTMEEVAEEYLSELVSRNLVQVSSVSLNGKVKGCWIHDLLRELILKKVDHLSFCKFVREDVKYLPSGIIRHLSLATTSNDVIESIESSHVRSLHFFTDEELPEYLVKRIPTKYNRLKVLDFESARSLDVPENLGDLIYLKYLSFRYTEIQSIPKSIGKLHNMETLDLRQTAVNELPKEICKLRMLRHLLGNKMSLIHLKDNIGYMRSLQTLSVVKIDEDGIELIRELEKLNQLRKLSLFNVSGEQGIALCSSINEMQHLEKLYIEAKSKDVAIDLDIVSYPTMLQKLRLELKLNKLPEWIPKLENLVELRLLRSQLTVDPLKSLQDLPNLLVLSLAVDSYEGFRLCFQEGGFKKLKELGLSYLYNLKSVIIKQGALKSLESLTFMNIPNLKMEPNGIHYLENLKVLNTYFMSTEFEKNIAPFAKPVKDKNLSKQKGKKASSYEKYRFS